MKFTKMHGCGNDYVYVDCTEHMLADPSAAAIAVSDRHFGVGGDGLILICPSDKADFRMAMYNADGSEGSMCGNGIRCVAKFVYDKGLTDKTTLNIETKAGIKTLELTVRTARSPSSRSTWVCRTSAPRRCPWSVWAGTCPVWARASSARP